MIKIRPGNPREAKVLSALCFASKAHWGYSAPFMESCREELSVTSKDFESDLILVAAVGDRLKGIAQVQGLPKSCELEKLFIAPEAIGQGLGKALFTACVENTKIKADHRAAQAITMKIVADPFAAAFYLKMGAIEAGSEPSKTWPNRHLPVLHYKIEAEEEGNKTINRGRQTKASSQ